MRHREISSSTCRWRWINHSLCHRNWNRTRQLATSSQLIMELWLSSRTRTVFSWYGHAGFHLLRISGFSSNGCHSSSISFRCQVWVQCGFSPEVFVANSRTKGHIGIRRNNICCFAHRHWLQISLIRRIHQRDTHLSDQTTTTWTPVQI